MAQVDEDVLDAIQDAYGAIGADLRKLQTAVMRINMLHALDPECVEYVFDFRTRLAGRVGATGARRRVRVPADEMFETEMKKP
jgi:hypothetical protein